MEEYEINPGTAGLTQRVSSKYETKTKEKDTEKLYVLESKVVMTCGHNQY